MKRSLLLSFSAAVAALALAGCQKDPTNTNVANEDKGKAGPSGVNLNEPMKRMAFGMSLITPSSFLVLPKEVSEKGDICWYSVPIQKPSPLALQAEANFAAATLINNKMAWARDPDTHQKINSRLNSIYTVQGMSLDQFDSATREGSYNLVLGATSELTFVPWSQAVPLLGTFMNIVTKAAFVIGTAQLAQAATTHRANTKTQQDTDRAFDASFMNEDKIVTHRPAQFSMLALEQAVVNLDVQKIKSKTVTCKDSWE